VKSKDYESTNQFNLKKMINKKRIEWFESSEQGILSIFGLWNRSK